MNDDISEKYRKYLIALKMEAATFYALWGTDMADNELDKLLIDSNNEILLFRKIEGLLSYLRNHNITVFKDNDNLTGWSTDFKNTVPYCTYNIDHLQMTMERNWASLEGLKPKDATELLDFYNLFGDYVYQMDTAALFKIIHEPNMKIFFDFYYNTYFWSSPEEGYDPEKKIDITKFKKNYLLLINTFKKQTHIIE